MWCLSSFKLIRWAQGKLPNTWTLIPCLLGIFIRRALSVMGCCKENTRSKKKHLSDFEVTTNFAVFIVQALPFVFEKGLRFSNMATISELSGQQCDPNSLHTNAFKGLRACVLIHFSRVRLFATLRTVAHQAHLSMGFSRQEYWSGLPFPTPGIEPGSPAFAVRFFTV